MDNNMLKKMKRRQWGAKNIKYFFVVVFKCFVHVQSNFFAGNDIFVFKNPLHGICEKSTFSVLLFPSILSDATDVTTNGDAVLAVRTVLIYNFLRNDSSGFCTSLA